MSQLTCDLKLSKNEQHFMSNLTSYWYWNRLVNNFISPRIMDVMRSKESTKSRTTFLEETLTALYQSYIPTESARTPIDQCMAHGFVEAFRSVADFRTKNLADSASGLACEESFTDVRKHCGAIVETFITALLNSQPEPSDWVEENQGYGDIPSSLKDKVDVSGLWTGSQSVVSSALDFQSVADTSREEKETSFSYPGSEGCTFLSSSSTIETHPHTSKSLSHLLRGLKTIGNCLTRRG